MSIKKIVLQIAVPYSRWDGVTVTSDNIVKSCI